MLVGMFVFIGVFLVTMFFFLVGTEVGIRDATENKAVYKNRKPSFWHIAGLSFFGVLAVAFTLFTVFTFGPYLGYGKPHSYLGPGSYHVVAVDCVTDTSQCNLLLREEGANTVRFYEVEKEDLGSTPEVGDTITVEEQYGLKYKVE